MTGPVCSSPGRESPPSAGPLTTREPRPVRAETGAPGDRARRPGPGTGARARAGQRPQRADGPGARQTALRRGRRAVGRDIGTAGTRRAAPAGVVASPAPGARGPPAGARLRHGHRRDEPGLPGAGTSPAGHRRHHPAHGAADRRAAVLPALAGRQLGRAGRAGRGAVRRPRLRHRPAVRHRAGLRRGFRRLHGRLSAAEQARRRAHVRRGAAGPGRRVGGAAVPPGGAGHERDARGGAARPHRRARRGPPVGSRPVLPRTHRAAPPARPYGGRPAEPGAGGGGAGRAADPRRTPLRTALDGGPVHHRRLGWHRHRRTAAHATAPPPADDGAASRAGAAPTISVVRRATRPAAPTGPLDRPVPAPPTGPGSERT